jgi:hypothetical protein
MPGIALQQGARVIEDSRREFRDDIAQFVPYEVVTACLGDYREMAPARGRYSAFTDPSGGSADSFTLAISHKDGDVVVIDAVREVRPPFSPDAVVDDFSALIKAYRITKVAGDRYAGEFPRELFKKRVIKYELSEKVKSDLYRDVLPLLNSGRIVLPNNDRLVSQLCGLERRVSRAGRDSIDRGPGGHDDLCNSVAGAADVAAKPGYDRTGALTASQVAYDTRVVGVVSGAGDYRPGIVLDKQASAESRTPIALLGKVYCKVDATYGPVEIGDLLTTSPTVGHAMKAQDPQRAFAQPLEKRCARSRTGKELIPILVALQ